MSLLAVRVTPRAGRDMVLKELFALGSSGVQEDGDSFVTHFNSDLDEDFLKARVRAIDPLAEVEVEETAQPDSSVWRGTVTAHTVGGLTVRPPWLPTANGSARTIVIDPAMAFGTGEHATTRLMLALLQSVIRKGDTVADLGAGSGVLAIAAAKLGARSVAAIEVDSLAISNAESNVEANGVMGIVTIVEGDATTLLPLLAPVSLVLANIHSSAIIELLPIMAAALAPGGRAVIGGIMCSERDSVVRALEEGGWRIIIEETQEEWWSSAIALR